jgi:AraC-like DNA-binding protein
MKLLSHYIKHQMKRYPEIVNWKNHIIDDGLYYSYRDTLYSSDTYPSNLHYHDYYELVVFDSGDIRYVCDDSVYYPKYGNIILIPPGKFHMSLINAQSTRYKRHVFYLYETAFEKSGCGELLRFLSEREGLLQIEGQEARGEFMVLLEKLTSALDHPVSPLDSPLAFSYVIQAFYLINRRTCKLNDESEALPKNVLALKNYIDASFAVISSVKEVAEHFFYSREYVSRLFKRYFDTTISEYIMKRRIAESQALISANVPIINVAYQVGFGSLSTFIRAFREVTNMTPSEYRKMQKETS